MGFEPTLIWPPRYWEVMGLTPCGDITWDCRRHWSGINVFGWVSVIIVALVLIDWNTKNWTSQMGKLCMQSKHTISYFILFFFTRHVSDKDRQSKLYRNVQPVFSIDDEDEDGGIDFIVWCNWFESECMKCSCRYILQIEILSLSHKRGGFLKETTNRKELSCQYSYDKCTPLKKEPQLFQKQKPLKRAWLIQMNTDGYSDWKYISVGMFSCSLKRTFDLPICRLFLSTINLAFVKIVVSISTELPFLIA